MKFKISDIVKIKGSDQTFKIIGYTTIYKIEHDGINNIFKNEKDIKYRLRNITTPNIPPILVQECNILSQLFSKTNPHPKLKIPTLVKEALYNLNKIKSKHVMNLQPKTNNKTNYTIEMDLNIDKLLNKLNTAIDKVKTLQDEISKINWKNWKNY